MFPNIIERHGLTPEAIKEVPQRVVVVGDSSDFRHLLDVRGEDYPVGVFLVLLRGYEHQACHCFRLGQAQRILHQADKMRLAVLGIGGDDPR